MNKPKSLYHDDIYSPDVNPKLKREILRYTYYRVKMHYGGFDVNGVVRPTALVRVAIKYREGFRLNEQEIKIYREYLLWDQDDFMNGVLTYLFSMQDSGEPFKGLINYYNTYGFLTTKQVNLICYERGDFRKRYSRKHYYGSDYCDYACDYDGYDPEPRTIYWGV